MFGFGLTKLIPYIAYIVCVLVFILTLLYRAELGFYLTIFLIPLQNLMEKLIEFPFGKDIIDLLIIATIIGCYIHQREEKITKNNKMTIFPVFLLMLGSYLALWVGSFKFGLPIPISLSNSNLFLWKNFMLMPIIYLITVKLIKDRKQMMIVILIMMTSVLLASVYFYNNARWFDLTNFHQDLRGKMVTTFSYLGPNEAAAFFSQMAIFFMGFYMLEKDKIIKLASLIVITLCSYCVLFLFSRGAYLSLLVGLIFLGLAVNRNLLFILISIIVFWNVVTPNAVNERIEMTMNKGKLDSSSQSRIEMWFSALEDIKANPITGIGLGSTKYLGIEHSGGRGVRKDIHNGYIEILLEQGIIGLFILLYVLYVAFRQGWLLYRESDDNSIKGLGVGLVAMTVVIVLNNITGDRWSYFNVMGYFWVIFGLVVKTIHFSRNEMLIQESV